MSIDCRFKLCSHGFVWVEHNSDVGAHDLGGEVLLEDSSDDSSVSVGSDNRAPSDSKSGVVDGVLGLIDECHSLAHVEPCAGDVVAVLDGQQSEVSVLTGLASSESSEHSLLIQSHGLRLVVHFLLGRLDFLHHSFFFNNDYKKHN